MKKTITIVLMTFALAALMLLPGHQVTAQGFHFEPFNGGRHLVPVYPNFIAALQFTPTNTQPYQMVAFTVSVPNGFGQNIDNQYLQMFLMSGQVGVPSSYVFFNKEAARQLEHDLRLILGNDVIP